MHIRRLSLLALASFILVTSPALAQRRPGGFGFGGGSLLQNESVQEELKLTADQKAKVEKVVTGAREKSQEQMRKAFQDRDFDKARELSRKITEEIAEGTKGVLTAEQQKRLRQIQLQSMGLRAFADPDAQKELKLTDKQIEEVKATLEDLNKDREELTKGIERRDFAKMRAAMEKFRKISEESQAKLIDSLSAEQKQAWKDMTGEKFEIRRPEFRRPGGDPEQPRRPGGRRPGSERPDRPQAEQPRRGADLYGVTGKTRRIGCPRAGVPVPGHGAAAFSLG